MKKNITEKGIIITGCIASSITAELAGRHKDELLARYPSYLVDKMLESADADMKNERNIAEKYDCGIFGMDESGFLETLWNMAEVYESGLMIDMKKVPIRQETVEVCEILDLDPYAMASKGCLMLVTDHALQLASELKKSGAGAEIIGYLTKGKARILTYGERTRYLDKPR